MARLTPRKMEVLQLIAQGYNNASIAEQLFIVEKSVETYINSILPRTSACLVSTGPTPGYKAALVFLKSRKVAETISDLSLLRQSDLALRVVSPLPRFPGPRR